MPTVVLIRRVAGLALIAAVASLALFVVRRRRHTGWARFPRWAAGIIGVTAAVTGSQLLFPAVLAALRRDPAALGAGQWWRLVTPLLVQADGVPQMVFNGAFAVVLTPVIERLYGGRRLLLLYLVAGLVGEVAGYAWAPHGAGSSVALAGLGGALLVWGYRRRATLPGPAGAYAVVGLAAAVVLSVVQDLHGPPTVTGAALAWLARTPDPATLAAGEGGGGGAEGSK